MPDPQTLRLNYLQDICAALGEYIQSGGHVHIDSDSTQGGDDHLTVTFTIEQGSIYLTLLRETMGRRLDDQNGRLD